MTDEQIVAVTKLMVLAEKKLSDFIYRWQKNPTHWLISYDNYNLLKMVAEESIYSIRLEGVDFSTFRGLKVLLSNSTPEGIAPCLL